MPFQMLLFTVFHWTCHSVEFVCMIPLMWFVWWFLFCLVLRSFILFLGHVEYGMVFYFEEIYQKIIFCFCQVRIASENKTHETFCPFISRTSVYVQPRYIEGCYWYYTLRKPSVMPVIMSLYEMEMYCIVRENKHFFI